MPSVEEDDSGARFFAVSSTATAIVDHDGRIRRVNAAWTSLVGRSEPGESFVHRVKPAERSVLANAMVGLRTGKAAALRLCLLRHDGVEMDVVCDLTAEDGGSCFYCAVRTVNPPPLRHDRPDLLSWLLKSLDETDAIGLLLLSSVANRPVYANDAAGRIWDFPMLAERTRDGTVSFDELRAHLENVVIDPRALAAVRTELSSPTGKREFELLLRGDRSVLWLVVPAKDEHGRPIGELYISKDITHRTVTEARLARALERQERSEAEFRRVLELLPAGVGIIRKGIVTYVNAAGMRIYGVERPEDVIGVHVSALVQPEDLSGSFERLRRMNESEAASSVRRFVRRDGSVGYLDTQGFPIELDGEQATMIVVNDVTEQRKIEAKMRQAERLASLGMVSAAIAHEINNPLAYILLNLQAIRRWLAPLVETSPHETISRTLELVDQSLEGADRVREIVRDLRVFSRADDAENSLVDVRTVIESVLPMAEHAMVGRATLVKKYEAVPPVRANAARLGQVFLNLLANAAQAIREGDESREIRIATFAEGVDKVVVTVSDDGEGMPPSVRERVFDPFFTTKGPGVGTGLGLSLCLGIVQVLGGDISVESEFGRGSVFRVTLPAASPTAEGEVTRPEAFVVPRSRILVIDDEPRIATRLADLLNEHDVAIVTTGKEAIARLQQEPFDAVFCDLMMPDVKGTDVFEVVTRERPALRDRFVFMTAGAFTPAARDLLDRATTLRLDKPFTEKQVQHVLALVLGASESKS